MRRTFGDTFKVAGRIRGASFYLWAVAAAAAALSAALVALPFGSSPVAKWLASSLPTVSAIWGSSFVSALTLEELQGSRGGTATAFRETVRASKQLLAFAVLVQLPMLVDVAAGTVGGFSPGRFASALVVVFGLFAPQFVILERAPFVDAVRDSPKVLRATFVTAFVTLTTFGMLVTISQIVVKNVLSTLLFQVLRSALASDTSETFAWVLLAPLARYGAVARTLLVLHFRAGAPNPIVDDDCGRRL